MTRILALWTSAVFFGEPSYPLLVKYDHNISFDRSRLSFEIVFENLLSSKKRAEDLMLSYAYRFGGGY